MKSMRILLALGAVAAAGCVPRSAPPPPPPPEPAPAPSPPAPPPPPADWRDVPLTPGGWVYSRQDGGSQALFGPAAGEAHFIVRCDLSQRRVILSRAGRTDGNAMTIRTSFGARSLPVTAAAEPLPYVSAALPAQDRLLDSMAFSRGRFTVEMPGTPMLVIPAWPEPARVIDECRG